MMYTLLSFKVYYDKGGLGIEYSRPNEQGMESYYNLLSAFGVGQTRAQNLLESTDLFREQMEEYLSE